MVERHAGGSWTVPRDFEERALQAEAKRQSLAINVRSWLPIEALVERPAETWLDRMDWSGIEHAKGDFAQEVRTCLQTRKAWLQREGVELDQAGRLTMEARTQLRRREFDAAIGREAARTGHPFVVLEKGEIFSGRCMRMVDLAQGRFAVIEGREGFTLVKSMKRQMNWRWQEVALSRSGETIQWDLSRCRSLGS